MNESMPCFDSLHLLLRWRSGGFSVACCCGLCWPSRCTAVQMLAASVRGQKVTIVNSADLGGVFITSLVSVNVCTAVCTCCKQHNSYSVAWGSKWIYVICSRHWRVRHWAGQLSDEQLLLKHTRIFWVQRSVPHRWWKIYTYWNNFRRNVTKLKLILWQTQSEKHRLVYEIKHLW